MSFALFTMAVSGAKKLMENEKVRNGLMAAGKKGLSTLVGMLDQDGDGDVDDQDIEKIFFYIQAATSLLGLAAAADGEVSDDEEEVAYEIIEKLVFSDEGILPEQALAALSLKKKEVKKQIQKFFYEPMSMKKIATYAVESDLEEFFYQYACTIVMADGKIDDGEREFLDELASKLDLSKFDVKAIVTSHNNLAEAG